MLPPVNFLKSESLSSLIPKETITNYDKNYEKVKMRVNMNAYAKYAFSMFDHVFMFDEKVDLLFFKCFGICSRLGNVLTSSGHKGTYKSE